MTVINEVFSINELEIMIAEGKKLLLTVKYFELNFFFILLKYTLGVRWRLTGREKPYNKYRWLSRRGQTKTRRYYILRDTKSEYKGL